MRSMTIWAAWRLCNDKKREGKQHEQMETHGKLGAARGGGVRGQR